MRRPGNLNGTDYWFGGLDGRRPGHLGKQGHHGARWTRSPKPGAAQQALQDKRLTNLRMKIAQVRANKSIPKKQREKIIAKLRASLQQLKGLSGFGDVAMSVDDINSNILRALPGLRDAAY